MRRLVTQGHRPDELLVATREPVGPGDPIRVEVSFGALSDEIEVDGVVHHRADADGAMPPIVTVRIEQGCDQRLRYIRSVLLGARTPTARRFRRVDASEPVRFRVGESLYSAQTQNLAQGGMFILHPNPPDVGEPLEIDLALTGHGRIVTRGQVMWRRSHGPESGFGARLLMSQKQDMAALDAFVRGKAGTGNFRRATLH